MNRYFFINRSIKFCSQFSKEEIEAAIETLGKGASVRGEALTLEEFARLSNILSSAEQ